MGAAFVNAGLLTLIICGIHAAVRAPMTEASVTCLSLVLGFGLFGKTLLNVWDIVAGFAHSSAAFSVGRLHTGLNLYSNGFAAGLVAAVLVPMILALRGRGKRPERV